MARLFPARWPRCLAVGAAAGAATGLALVTAEAGSSLLAHSALPARAWAFLAAYCVPAFAIGGALLALALTAERATSALVWLSCIAYSTAVASQDLIGGRSRVAPLRIAALLVSAAAGAAAAWAAERVIERRGPGRVPGLVLRMVLLLPIVAAVQLGGRALHGAPKEAALALPVAVAAGGVMAAVLLAPLAARVAALPAAGGAAALAAVIALASAAQAARPARGALRDQTQPSPPPAAFPLPNVVLIVLDTVRASNVSSYGYERRTTPHLDAFAAGAVRFSTATTVSSWSVPAHASLFTGLFAPEHGAGLSLRDASRRLERPAPLDASLVTLAEHLAERGYATAGISANLLLAPHMNLTQGFRYLDVRASPRALNPRYRTLLLRAESLLPAALLADPVLATFPSTFRSAEEITDAAGGLAGAAAVGAALPALPQLHGRAHAVRPAAGLQRALAGALSAPAGLRPARRGGRDVRPAQHHRRGDGAHPRALRRRPGLPGPPPPSPAADARRAARPRAHLDHRHRRPRRDAGRAPAAGARLRVLPGGAARAADHAVSARPLPRRPATAASTTGRCRSPTSRRRSWPRPAGRRRAKRPATGAPWSRRWTASAGSPT